MNVTYPMVPEEVTEFCANKRSVCIVEEGFPDYLEQALNATLRKADLNTTIVGKDVFPKAGEYQSEVMMNGLAKFVEGAVPKGIDLALSRPLRKPSPTTRLTQLNCSVRRSRNARRASAPVVPNGPFFPR